MELERPAVVADVLQFLGERVAQAYPLRRIFGRKFIGSLQFGDVIFSRRLRAQVGTKHVCIRIVGVNLQAPVQGFFRRLYIAHCMQYCRQVVDVPAVIRLKLTGAFVMPPGIVKQPQVVQYVSKLG